MTREEILAMEAGEELDKLVAELVMGQEKQRVRLDSNEVDMLLPGLYSTDISAAWQVALKAKLENVPVLATEQQSAEWICKQALLTKLKEDKP